MDLISIFGLLMGVAVLVFIILAVFRGELSDQERAKYEMLGISPPEETAERKPGRIGIEDRIIRLGLVGAAFYYAAARIGWENPAGIALAVLASYLLLTGIVGRDPIYFWRHWDTRFKDT